MKPYPCVLGKHKRCFECGDCGNDDVKHVFRCAECRNEYRAYEQEYGGLCTDCQKWVIDRVLELLDVLSSVECNYLFDYALDDKRVADYRKGWKV